MKLDEISGEMKVSEQLRAVSQGRDGTRAADSWLATLGLSLRGSKSLGVRGEQRTELQSSF